MLAAVLGPFAASVAFLAWRIERQAILLKLELAQATAKIEEKSFPEIPDFDELRESLEDLIADTIVPNEDGEANAGNGFTFAQFG